MVLHSFLFILNNIESDEPRNKRQRITRQEAQELEDDEDEAGNFTIATCFLMLNSRYVLSESLRNCTCFIK